MGINRMGNNEFADSLQRLIERLFREAENRCHGGRSRVRLRLGSEGEGGRRQQRQQRERKQQHTRHLTHSTRRVAHSDLFVSDY